MSEIPVEYRAVLDGHVIDLRKADRFYSGRDGRRVTDEEWDTSRDRTAASIDDLRALGFEHVGTNRPDGDTIAEVR